MALPQLKDNYMRPEKRREIEQEIASCDRQLSNANPLENVDRRKVAQRKRRLERDLETQKPPTLSDAERFELEKRQQSLEETLKKKMLPRDVMMRNPSGAVGKNREFEKKHKKDVFEWKRNQVVLYQDSDDPDIANVERLRSDTDTSVNYSDAQIPPKVMSVPSELFMANYDNINWDSEQAAKLTELERRNRELEEKIRRVEALEETLQKRVNPRKRNFQQRKAFEERQQQQNQQQKPAEPTQNHQALPSEG